MRESYFVISYQNMSFFSKFGRSLRSFGSKVSHGIRTAGSKVGDFLLGTTIPGIGPEAAALAGPVGAAAKGLGTLAGVAEKCYRWEGVDVAGAKAGASAVKDAYRSIKGRGSPLERGWLNFLKV